MNTDEKSALSAAYFLKFWAQESGAILYRKNLNGITGSVTATLLLSQIIYWDDKSGGEEFYKFKSPCAAHSLYKTGDSWTEELGFTVREFTTARDKLAEKKIISFRTDGLRNTFYKLNRAVLIELLEQLNDKSAFSESEKLNDKSAFSESQKRIWHVTKAHLVNDKSAFTSIYREYTENTQEITHGSNTMSSYAQRPVADDENCVSVDEYKTETTPPAKTKAQEKADALTRFTQEAVGYLNLCTDKRYGTETADTVKKLKALHKAGFTLEQVALVVDEKVRQWAGNFKMLQYLRPATLFSMNNFTKYLDEAQNPIQQTPSNFTGTRRSYESDRGAATLQGTPNTYHSESIDWIGRMKEEPF